MRWDDGDDLLSVATGLFTTACHTITIIPGPFRSLISVTGTGTGPLHGSLSPSEIDFGPYGSSAAARRSE